jgi:hypothetical protein
VDQCTTCIFTKTTIITLPLNTSHAIKIWVKNFEETGSALKKPPGKERSTRMPEYFDTVRAALEQSP